MDFPYSIHLFSPIGVMLDAYWSWQKAILSIRIDAFMLRTSQTLKSTDHNSMPLFCWLIHFPCILIELDLICYVFRMRYMLYVDLWAVIAQCGHPDSIPIQQASERANNGIEYMTKAEMAKTKNAFVSSLPLIKENELNICPAYHVWQQFHLFRRSSSILFRSFY